jgi:uncharacterized protein (TIGR01777 family)
VKVLIAGGRGFLGRSLTHSLRAEGHQVRILTRAVPADPDEVRWDGRTAAGWGETVSEVDAVVHFTGYSLSHWPWTNSHKRRFIESRVRPGEALVSAIERASPRPRMFLQASGISYYGLSGDGLADEFTPAGDDFLARMCVAWEAASEPVEAMGVRRIITRNAVVLDSHALLLMLMALPVRLYAGGPHGSGRQAMPWIHLADYLAALHILIGNDQARGPYNLIAPAPSSNSDFMRALCGALRRPCWFRTPAWLLRGVLGEMSTLLLGGRFCRPKRLLELGYRFQFAELAPAFDDLFHR